MCERLHASEPRLRVMEATAEATGLPSGSVEMVSAGRALHWFRVEEAMVEFRRVLKPGGWVAIVAFGRSEGGRAENEALERLLRVLTAGGQDTHASYAVYTEMKRWFRGGVFHHTERREETRWGWEDLRGMVMSLSHAPRAESGEFPEFEGRLREFFERYAREGQVTLATRYWINAGRFAT